MAVSQEDILKSFKGMNEEDQSALLVSMVSDMSVMSTVKAVEAMEEKFGVSAAASMAVAMPGVGAAGGEAAQAEEKTEFNVVMSSFGENKVSVIKAVRTATGLGLKEAKDLVESAPATIKENLPKEEAEKLVKELTDAGAQAEIK